MKMECIKAIIGKALICLQVVVPRYSVTSVQITELMHLINPQIFKVSERSLKFLCFFFIILSVSIAQGQDLEKIDKKDQAFFFI